MLKFDSVNHVYEYDGVKIPSVTQLIPSMNEYDFVGNRDVLKEALKEGKKNHYELELAIRYKQHTEYTEKIFAELEKYDILKKYPEVFLSEQILYSKKHKFAGTPDLVLKGESGLCIIDLKRSNSAYPFKHCLQLYAYQILVEENYFSNVQEKFIITLKNVEDDPKIIKHESEFAEKIFIKLAGNYWFNEKVIKFMNSYK